MSIELDHIIVPASDRRVAAAVLAGLLGVAWSEADGNVWEALTRSYARRPRADAV